jgi:[acyl-carrier-protein] S-malonyltransferase
MPRNLMFVFPGQGAQYRGMGSDLVAEFDAAREVYERASAVVDFDLETMSFTDPDSQLDLTRYTQPALLTHEVACLEAYRSLVGDAVTPMLAAGHSLGEYTALVAAGALQLEQAVDLVRRRGELMGEFGRGSMLATTLDLESARGLADNHYCGIGGCNLPEQTVIAGEDADLERLAVELKERYPRKRGIPLKTEGAFHTYLMIAAAQQFRLVLQETEFAPAAFPVLSNYTGKAHQADSASIRSRLFFQLFNPVRWVGSMNTAVDMEVGFIVEFGGGIGKGDTPAEMRPNLESIVKKSLKWRGHEAEYRPAINVETIRAAVL